MRTDFKYKLKVMLFAFSFLVLLLPSRTGAQGRGKTLTNEDFPAAKEEKSVPLDEYYQNPREIKFPSGFVISVPGKWKTDTVSLPMLDIGEVPIGIGVIEPNGEIGFLFSDYDNNIKTIEDAKDAKKLLKEMEERIKKSGGSCKYREDKINNFDVLILEAMKKTTKTDDKLDIEAKRITAIFFKGNKYLVVQGLPTKYYAKYEPTIMKIFNSIRN